MATPALESFCCLDHHDDNVTTISSSSHRSSVFTEQSLKAYNYICIASGCLGILGSLYQLFPRKPNTVPVTRRAFRLYTRQNIIICFLALSDLLATLGIVVRSSMWLSGYFPGNRMELVVNDTTIHPDHHLHLLSCAILSGWIQYFYICTYAWTMCYAIDIYRLLRDQKSPLCLYHVVCWGISFLFTTLGLISLYYPSLLECAYDVLHVLPHFLIAYITILAVMFCNPILYWQAAKTVQENVMLQTGRYTDHERSVVSSVRSKFRHVIVVFFVCWGANIVNGILLIFRHRISADVFIILWMAMAVLNPLQGFLNCLVYKGAGGFNLHLRQTSPDSRPGIYRSFFFRSDGSDDEDAPLLSYRGGN